MFVFVRIYAREKTFSKNALSTNEEKSKLKKVQKYYKKQKIKYFSKNF